MTLADKQRALVAELGSIPDPQARLAHVVLRGRQPAGLEAAYRTPGFRVEGCLSNLWFVPEFRDGRCWFRADSDSAIVKGVAVLLCEFYSGHAPDEIVARPPDFLREVGITQHLTPNRRNGLARLWERIRGFAESHRRPLSAGGASA
jgi:cysteine desulfuration protein SufE